MSLLWDEHATDDIADNKIIVTLKFLNFQAEIRPKCKGKMSRRNMNSGGNIKNKRSCREIKCSEN